ARRNSGEVGHPNYQHPLRAREEAYGLEVDRVPLLVVATALRGLIAGGRGLWERYYNGDNLLFLECDLRDPVGSTLFRELRQVPDPLLKTHVGHLERACLGKLGDAPLLEAVLPEEKPPASSRSSARTQGASATTTSVTPGTDWDFGDPATPAQPRDKKSVGGMWSWVAAGAAVLVLAGIGVFFATRGRRGHSKGPHPAKDHTATDKPPPKDNGNKPPLKDAGTKLPPPKPLPPEAGPGVFYLAACRPELLATGSQVDRNWILWDASTLQNPREFTGHEG